MIELKDGLLLVVVDWPVVSAGSEIFMFWTIFK